MIALRLEESLLEEIDAVAEQRDMGRSALIREAIIRFLEDNEDLELAKSAQKKMKKSISLAQLRKELGLDS
jgi:metal-responsive CopG/Arc/MetJ family transcriptional regulator